ncbi:MAG: LapA family protein [Parvibaculales bacterium]
MQFILRLFGFALLVGLAVVLVPLAILNSQMVSVRLNPLALFADGDDAIGLPLFIVMAAMLLIGFIGGIVASAVVRWKRRGSEKLASWRNRKQAAPVDVPSLSTFDKTPENQHQTQQALPAGDGVLKPAQRN